MKKRIYLDYAAATPVDAKVVAAMQPYLTETFYNPSATYLSAKEARAALASARADVGLCLGARHSEIVFTSGATEANNLAIHGIMRRYPEANLVISAIEHESVLAPAARHSHQISPVREDGVIDTQEFKNRINEKTVLVSVMYANNEIGTVQPLREIAVIIRDVRQQRQIAGNSLPIYLHTDAAQAANYLDVHVSRLGVDLMSLNGSKVYGPKGSGVLYVKTGVELEPLLDGGGQEGGLRSGTENMPAIVGFAAALKTATEMRHKETKRLQTLQAKFLSGLSALASDLITNGSLRLRLPNNIHASFPGTDNERLMVQLDERGILCAAGSACSASKDEPSHVLKAIGKSDEAARSSLRFSMGRATTTEDVDYVLQVLTDLL